MESNEEYFQDEDDYMNFESSSIRPRFKNGMDIRKLVGGGGVSFEIDTEETSAIIEDSELFEDPSFAEQYMKEVIEKKNNSMQSLFKTMTLDSVGGNYDELDKKMENVTEDGGVKKMILNPGNGAKVSLTSKVYVHYVAVSEGSDEPYDSTLARKKAAVFKLDEANIIPGLYLAVTSMNVGEISNFLIKPEYAYKSCGIPPRVPPNCRILFVVELLEAFERDQLPNITQKSPDERALMEFSEICKEANKLRSDGNDDYICSRYSIAVRRYRDAIRILEDYPVVSEENENSRNEILFTLYINLAQSYLKLEKGPQACVASRMALRFDMGAKGKLYKALYRFARAKFLLGSYEDAQRLNDRALKLQPGMKTLKDFRTEILKKIREDEITSKVMYKKMFQNDSSDTSSVCSDSTTATNATESDETSSGTTSSGGSTETS